ncbi:MAG: hypothetical protein AB8G86_05985 [Saprospiraceae bacterium]
MNSVWVFHGAGSRFTSGVFTDKTIAEEWITKNMLTGILTKYPINIGTYDWAISESFFEPKKEKHKSAEFIQKFTSASQEHYHYENGDLE